MSKETNKKSEKIEFIGTPYPFGDTFKELIDNERRERTKKAKPAI